MKSGPKRELDHGFLTSRRIIASLFGITDEALTTANDIGGFLVPVEDKYDLFKSVQNYVSYLKGKTGRSGAKTDLTRAQAEEKIMLTRAQRQMRELELSQASGILIRASDADAMFLSMGKLVSEWFESLRDQIERKTAAPLPVLDSVEAATDELRAELHTLMESAIKRTVVNRSLPEIKVDNEDAGEPD